MVSSCSVVIESGVGVVRVTKGFMTRTERCQLRDTSSLKNSHFSTVKGRTLRGLLNG